jgi:proline dehydrogenase
VKKFIVDLLPSYLVKTFASPYLAGEGVDEVVAKGEDLYKQNNIYSTLDLLGEDILHEKDANDVTAVYLELSQRVKNQEHATLSLKPTSLGLDISNELCDKNFTTILEASQQQNVPITIDMESSLYTDQTLEIYKKYLLRYPGLGTVLQSRLFRTVEDVKKLNEFSKAHGQFVQARIRLCIGIYLEKADIAHTDKQVMKKVMLELMQTLLEGGQKVELATHDEEVIRQALAIIATHPEWKERLEFQMLYGVQRETIVNELKVQGYRVRVYLPFATEWKFAIKYLKRRLHENPQLAVYTLKNLFFHP